MTKRTQAENEEVKHERLTLLQQIEDRFETPVVVLGFLWLVLLVLDLVWGLSPFLQSVSDAIWIVFIVDFGVRFLLAPRKGIFLRQNWLTVISLLLPALRIFRAARILRAARGLRLVRLLGSINRGMQALGSTMGRRGFGYVMALTLLVTVVGAAGMYAFESGLPKGQGMQSYTDALWWTAMIMTSLGSEYWPRTGAGRLLGFVLSVYAVAVFGYITASLASFFIGQDADSKESQVASEQSIRALQQEIASLRQELRAQRQTGSPPDG